MNGYNIPSRPVTEDGFTFDSVLERDWAGYITHLGLRWRQEPFAIREGRGRTTSLNVVARPDFFLPDIAVIFECKPTPEHVDANTERWHKEAVITGLPVVVTEGRPVTRVVDLDLVPKARQLGRRAPESLLGVGVVMPPLLSLFRETGPSLQTYIAQCPDCMAHGLLSISRDWPTTPVDLWLSPCRHRPRWSIQSVNTAITGPFPKSGDWGRA
jgi:hypothetical protein